jgi:hypothetical protein
MNRQLVGTLGLALVVASFGSVAMASVFSFNPFSVGMIGPGVTSASTEDGIVEPTAATGTRVVSTATPRLTRPTYLPPPRTRYLPGPR